MGEPASITSVHNPRIKELVKLRDRKHRELSQRFLIDGFREIERAARANVALEELILDESLETHEPFATFLRDIESRGTILTWVSRPVIEKLAFGDRSDGIVAVGKIEKPILAKAVWNDHALVAVIQGIEKPGNLGAIARSASAAGVAAIIVADGVADAHNPNCIRASTGAVFSLPIYEATRDEVLAHLRQHHFRLLATRVDGATPYHHVDLTRRTAILFGAEDTGLPPEWNAADITNIAIPVHGEVDSLNVSNTAAILFYEALRQRVGR